ncbi:MAG: class I SAM-dependent methyltransferase [Actinobacteria bacterium]|nr:class I SAM-dependent methyltransferase [Actinomycetota bacterium]
MPEARRRRDRQHRRRQPVRRPRRRHARRADPRGQRRHGGRRPPGADDRALLAGQEGPAAARLLGRAPGVADERARHDVGLPRLQPRGGARAAGRVEVHLHARDDHPGGQDDGRDRPRARADQSEAARFAPVSVDVDLHPPQRRLDLPHLRALRAAARVHDRSADRRPRRAGRVGALLLLLGHRRRRGPRAVADPRRRALQRGDGAGRARRARRSDQRPADHAAAHLRARATDRARARGPAVALRAGHARDRARADDRRPRRRAREDRGARGGAAVSTTVTRDAEGTVTGNTYDKYGSTNPVVRRLMATFQRSLGELFEQVDPASVLDVGCGEAILTHQWAAARPATRVVGFDLEDPQIQRHWQQRTAPNLEYRILRAQEAFPFEDGEFALATAVEVLEHVPDPERTLVQMARCARGGHVLVSVPHEPLWRGLNVARGAYVKHLGNTPGHVNHWTRWGFRRFVASVFDVDQVRSPLPWTMVRATTR